MLETPDIVGYIECDANTACERLVAEETLYTAFCLAADEEDDGETLVVVLANLAQLSHELQLQWDLVRERIRHRSPRAQG